MKPVLIREHVECAPAGLLGEWLEARGIAYEVDRTWVEPSVPDPREYAWIASLGHDQMAGDTHDPAVAAERELLALAVERDVPGARALLRRPGAGGGARRRGRAGARWRSSAGARSRPTTPTVIPAGPWLEWHFERFCTPPGATELARTADAPQAYRYGPHLGVQFHPEATVEIVAGWARADGVEADLSAPPEQLAAARDAAFRLFDGFLAVARHARSA